MTCIACGKERLTDYTGRCDECRNNKMREKERLANQRQRDRKKAARQEIRRAELVACYKRHGLDKLFGLNLEDDHAVSS